MASDERERWLTGVSSGQTGRLVLDASHRIRRSIHTPQRGRVHDVHIKQLRDALDEAAKRTGEEEYRTARNQIDATRSILRDDSLPVAHNSRRFLYSLLYYYAFIDPINEYVTQVLGGPVKESLREAYEQEHGLPHAHAHTQAPGADSEPESESESLALSRAGIEDLRIIYEGQRQRQHFYEQHTSFVVALLHQQGKCRGIHHPEQQIVLRNVLHRASMFVPDTPALYEAPGLESALAYVFQLRMVFRLARMFVPMHDADVRAIDRVESCLLNLRDTADAWLAETALREQGADVSRDPVAELDICCGVFLRFARTTVQDNPWLDYRLHATALERMNELNDGHYPYAVATIHAMYDAICAASTPHTQTVDDLAAQHANGNAPEGVDIEVVARHSTTARTVFLAMPHAEHLIELLRPFYGTRANMRTFQADTMLALPAPPPHPLADSPEPGINDNDSDYDDAVFDFDHVPPEAPTNAKPLTGSLHQTFQCLGLGSVILVFAWGYALMHLMGAYGVAGGAGLSGGRAGRDPVPVETKPSQEFTRRPATESGLNERDLERVHLILRGLDHYTKRCG